MDQPSLTKSDVAWLSVRILGLYFFGLGILNLANLLIASGYLPGEFFQRVFSRGVLQSAFHITLGIYGMFFGQSAHQILMGVPQALIRSTNTNQSNRAPELGSTPSPWLSEIPQEKRDPKTTLTETESTKFGEWLQKNKTISRRSFEDQIALFRDHQNSSRKSEA
jgi:hypothetical protein